MAMRGDLLYPLRQSAVAAPILVAIVIFSLWMWRRPLAPQIYLVGLSILAIAAFIPFLPTIDGGYRQVYWLGEERHEIPWQYDPYNGSIGRGGKYFLARVSVPDLVPRYEFEGETVTIGKSTDFDYGKGGAAPEKICVVNALHMKCEWRRGKFVYSASGSPEHFPLDAAGLMVSVADLLDSFEVSSP